MKSKVTAHQPLAGRSDPATGDALIQHELRGKLMETGACCVRPVKSLENLAQFFAWSPDTAVAYLEVHLRTFCIFKL